MPQGGQTPRPRGHQTKGRSAIRFPIPLREATLTVRPALRSGGSDVFLVIAESMPMGGANQVSVRVTRKSLTAVT